MFPKLCTFVSPTRRRPDMLARSIESVFATAADPRRIEYLIGVDSDDEGTLRVLPELIGPDVRAIVGARPLLKYRGIGEIYLNLCRLALGTWIWVWNDDAEIEGNGWDNQLARAPLDSVVLPAIDLNGTCRYDLVEGGPFPCATRSTFARLPTPCDPIDVKLDEIRKYLNWTNRFLPDVAIRHHRAPPIID